MLNLKNHTFLSQIKQLHNYLTITFIFPYSQDIIELLIKLNCVELAEIEYAKADSKHASFLS